MTIEKDGAKAAVRILVNGVVIRLVTNAFAFCFKEARLSTTWGADIEHDKYLGQPSIVMRTSTSTDGSLLSHFDKIDESQAEINNISLKHHLVNNRDIAANKGKIKSHLPLERIFGFFRTYKKTFISNHKFT